MSPPSPETPDPALGVFETLLVSEGHIHALDPHLERLEHSLAALYGCAGPPALGAELAARAATLTGAHRLRVDAVPGAERLAIEVTISKLAPGTAAGVVCGPVLMPGGLGAHKWRDRRWLTAAASSGTVALLTDADGCVLEAGWASFWLREDERLVTPPADGRLLPGVTRARLLSLAPVLGLTAAEEPISLARAGAASEMFLTSSVRLAVPAVIVRGRDALAATAPEPSPALRRIRAALSR